MYLILIGNMYKYNLNSMDQVFLTIGQEGN